MSNIISFEVPGKPQGKGRPRFVSQGRFIRAYTPAKTADYEARIRAGFIAAKNSTGFVKFDAETPLKMTVFACFEPPKSASQKKRRALLLDGLYTHKPDADNILKVVCDALNGVAYDDDAQIVRMECYKMYGLTERLAVYIMEADNGTEADDK